MEHMDRALKPDERAQILGLLERLRDDYRERLD
jgi:hypothetical protein